MIVETLLLEPAFSLVKNWSTDWQASSSLLRGICGEYLVNRGFSHTHTHTHRASGDQLKSYMVEEYRGAGVVATYEKQ